MTVKQNDETIISCLSCFSVRRRETDRQRSTIFPPRIEGRWRFMRQVSIFIGHFASITHTVEAIERRSPVWTQAWLNVVVESGINRAAFP